MIIRDSDDVIAFLECVRQFKHIGYGNMIQLIAYEWSETAPERAVMELAPKDPHPELIEAMFNDKARHPLAAMWSRFEE